MSFKKVKFSTFDQNYMVKKNMFPIKFFLWNVFFIENRAIFNYEFFICYVIPESMVICFLSGAKYGFLSSYATTLPGGKVLVEEEILSFQFDLWALLTTWSDLCDLIMDYAPPYVCTLQSLVAMRLLKE